MPLRAVAYVSQAVTGLQRSKIESITSDSRYFNQLAGVTGVMLFDGFWFFQYIEGPESAIHAVYDRITGSRSHASINELARSRIEERLFPYWSMREIPIDSVLLGRLMMAEWLDLTRQGLQVDGTGVHQLQTIVRPYVEAAQA